MSLSKNNRIEAMSAYMILLSVNLDVLSEIEGTPFYSGKVKMYTKALLQELERQDIEINKRRSGETVDEHANMMSQYGTARDSLYKLFDLWRRLVTSDEAEQKVINNELVNMLIKL